MTSEFLKCDNVLLFSDDEKELKIKLHEKTKDTMDDDDICAGLDRIEIWGYNPIFTKRRIDDQMVDLRDEYLFGNINSEDFQDSIGVLFGEKAASEKLGICLYEVYIGLCKKRTIDSKEMFIERVHNFMLWFEKHAEDLEVYGDIDYDYATKLFHGQKLNRYYEFGTREHILHYYKQGVSTYTNPIDATYDELDFEAVFWDYNYYSEFADWINPYSSVEHYRVDMIERCLVNIFLYLSAKRVNEDLYAFEERVHKFWNLKEIQMLRVYGLPMVLG